MVMMKVPKISNPKEVVDVEYIDLGEIYKKVGGYKTLVKISEFKFLGKKFQSVIDSSIEELWSRPGQKNKYRYNQDCHFLKSHDLDLTKADFI